MSDVRELLVRITGDSAGLTKALGEAEAGSAKTGSKFANFGKVVADSFAVAGAAVVAIGVASIKSAATFQEGMTTLVTGAGESEKNIKAVSDGILDLATATGTTTKQLTDGMFMIESAGFHGAAGLTILKAAAEGAKVGNADLGTVSDAVTTILKDFGDTGITAAGAVNTLVATVANGKTHMQDLSQSLSMILPTASAAKVGLNDVMGAMATMTGEGVPAADAATYLRQMMLSLIAPTSGASDMLASLGLSTSKVANEMQKSLPGAVQMITDAIGKKFPVGSAQYVEAIKTISGGSKTMQGMLDLSGQHLKDFQANVETVGGSVKEAGDKINGWNKVQQDFNFRMGQLKEAVSTAGIKIGTALLPMVSELATRLGTFVQSDKFKVWLKSITDYLSTEVPKAITYITQTLWPEFKKIWDNIWPVIKTTLGNIQDLVKFLSDNMWVFWGVVTVLTAIKVGMALEGALEAFQGVMTGVKVSYGIMQALISSPLALPAIAVAGALADIALVYEAVQSVRGAIDAMNNAKTAADNKITSDNTVIQRLQGETLSSDPAIRNRAFKVLAEMKSPGYQSASASGGWASGGFTGPGNANDVAGVVHKGEYVIPKAGVDQGTGLPKGGGASVTLNVNVGMYAGMPVEKRQIALELYKELVRAARSQGVSLPMIGAMSPQ